tara:strand:- start:1005 stop:1745 length:741 start_codon:yes stop_codon:yes gene_type:complete
MKKILLVSGCSWGDKNFQSLYHQDMDCSWPKWCDLLAEKLDMQLVNLCKMGAGNEYIYSSLFDYITTNDTKNIGLVLAAWSQCQRRDFAKDDKWTNYRIDTTGDVLYWIKKSLRYMKSFELLCENYNLNYKHFQMIQLYKDIMSGLRPGEWEILKGTYDKKHRHQVVENKEETYQKIIKILMNFEPLTDKNFIGWPIDEKIGGFSFNNFLEEWDKISDIDRHPNEKGQIKIMELLYDRLGQRLSTQ